MKGNYAINESSYSNDFFYENPFENMKVTHVFQSVNLLWHKEDKVQKLVNINRHDNNLKVNHKFDKFNQTEGKL